MDIIEFGTKNHICRIGDDTGIVNAEIVDSPLVQVGAIILIKDVFSEVRNEHIMMIVKDKSKISHSSKQILKIALKNNISAI